MANSRTQANDFPPDRWILLSLCLATFVAACVAGIVDVYTGGISAYLEEHPTPLDPPSWIFSAWIWVPIMLLHALVFKLLCGPDRPFEMPRYELLRCFMKEYGDWWTLGFACEAFVVVFINTATAPISAVPEPLASACIAAATAEAAFCFVYTSLNSKAYAVMNAMSEAQANGEHPLFGARGFAPNYASMIGLSEMIGSIHAAILCAILPGTLQTALSGPENPNWEVTWALFLIVLAGGLATTMHGNCIFGILLFYLMCWFPALRTFRTHHAQMGGDGWSALSAVKWNLSTVDGTVGQVATQLENSLALSPRLTLGVYEVTKSCSDINSMLEAVALAAVVVGAASVSRSQCRFLARHAVMSGQGTEQESQSDNDAQYRHHQYSIDSECESLSLPISMPARDDEPGPFVHMPESHDAEAPTRMDHAR